MNYNWRKLDRLSVRIFIRVWKIQSSFGIRSVVNKGRTSYPLLSKID